MFPNLYWDVVTLQRKAERGEYPIQPVWGYFVYRTTYKDQKLWDDYLEYIYQAVKDTTDWRVSSDWWVNPYLPPENRVDSEDKLRAEGEVVKSTFHLCVREGPDLDGRSVDEIKKINANWLRSLNELTDSGFSELPGCLSRHLDRDMKHRNMSMARYDYLIYVDDDMLDKFREIRAANTTDEHPEFAPSFKHNVAVKVAWAGDMKDLFSDSDSDSDSEPDPDTTKVWQLLHVYRLPRFYDILVGSNEAWWGYFRRPPHLNLLPLD
ncbi:hypothetical protein F5X68DRAFT_187166 [Plectosphaerella plurivora]|uniref:Uncharacterized protein n=1 Tax=Plectosphaerella plurivora TaxID=936078 RepID=A0A9P8VKV0_9PEZI|nr:hypothetical protein F5X68DRAFT_187166 [Plectosphaerella plurivora]